MFNNVLLMISNYNDNNSNVTRIYVSMQNMKNYYRIRYWKLKEIRYIN